MMLLALTLSFSAFTALSLAMEKHQHDLHGKAAASPARRTQFRVLGWALLAVAFALCVADHGWAMGPVLWLGTMTLGGAVLSFGLYPYRPKWIAALAIALPAAGLLVAVL
ncbi:hypothetical protein SMSKK35_1392 [Stenotrophomonas maltophilia SKK35]|uniref:DUF3325 domain-containing protein n=1 Tax=Stenotrophomonas maltophilia TaxID=40324 RepID=A0AAJ2JBY2_STEMA|nr:MULTISPECIES: DUF3325 domain-containing protein [Stenotrophomonas]CCP10767.1 hypothetical protein SMSKK35_1392 [Stenotrophomonas maltophilia SKK35]MBH1366409.1 DUF3325 domain-containing protein [Stenotrophomonas maltophilia]MDQ7282036.1 DUF3325 domain-containing protein [Stenotrophomonas sp. Sm6012]MDT3467122.1 DUF3325 domain-containing protein [Stenotrophomonas maltophilia]HDS1126297.1 DUF3325 domain-containing protein [Stenotrophomonas maltophilia]